LSGNALATALNSNVFSATSDNTPKVVVINEPLYYYRRHGQTAGNLPRMN
jgi:hypothetical protein